MTAHSGRSHIKTAPGCYVFSYWIGKPRTKGLTGEQIQAGASVHQYAPDCPERKQKRRIPMLKSFPGEVSGNIFLIAARHYLIKREIFSYIFPALIIFISSFFVLFSLKSGKREKNTAFLYVFSYLTPLFPRSAAVFHGVSTVKNNAQSPAVIGLPRSPRSPRQKYDRWTLIRETRLVNYFLVIFNFFGNFYYLTI